MGLLGQELKPLAPWTAFSIQWQDAPWKMEDGGAQSRSGNRLSRLTKKSGHRPPLWSGGFLVGPKSSTSMHATSPYVLGHHVGPWILVLEPNWSRSCCLGLMMCLGSWAVFPSHVRLPSGPFDPCACLWLAMNLWLGSYLLVSCIFGPNSPIHIFRPSSVEFINKSSYARIYSFWYFNFAQDLTVKKGQNRPSTRPCTFSPLLVLE